MALEIGLPIKVEREHPDDSMATEAGSKSATSIEYFRLFKSSVALDAELGLKMVEYRLLAWNESVQVASQANALPPLKEKDVTPTGLLRSPRSRHKGSRME